jgi:hypothetical protein
MDNMEHKRFQVQRGLDPEHWETIPLIRADIREIPVRST